ncbi:MAG: Iron-sulfur assembly protein 1 [Chaenotheca gracillima]|nr:MAG: Iron-sulfur assembly protein 1 [Chaenotheca gracillima]
MAPTEASILSTFLLSPAPLPTVLSLRKFTELFPRSQRSNPRIPALYRELQHQRAMVLERVKKNIATEARRGELQRREVVKMRRKSEREELGFDEHDAREMEMEVELLGPTSHLPQRNLHELSTVVPELESACSDLESEISQIDTDIETLLDSIRSTVDDLSDLRYGKLGRVSGGAQDIGQEIFEGLQNLQRTCDNDTEQA